MAQGRGSGLRARGSGLGVRGGAGRRRQARWACGSGRGLVSRKQNGEDGTQRGSQESPGSAATPTPQLPGPLAHTQPLSR